MRLTRVIAGFVMASSLGLCAFSSLQAQSLRNAGPPAEFPPDSFKGSQYVDSRGCIYIRAGVDGYTTWVPRVSRDRKVVCGYKPSLAPGSGTTAVASAPKSTGVEQITLPPSQQPAAAAKPATTATASTSTSTVSPASPTPTGAGVAGAGLASVLGLDGPAPSAGPEPTVYQNPTPKVAKPAPTATNPAQVKTATVQPSPSRTPSPGPEPTVFKNPPAEVAQPTATQPARVKTAAVQPTQTRKPSPGPEPTIALGRKDPTPAPASAPTARRTVAVTTTPASPGVRCSNASEFSQRYINDGSRHPVRCGPQAASPYTYVNGSTTASAGAASTGTYRTVGTATTGSAATVSSSTRVVPRHVYDNRQNTQNVTVPNGFATVWEDGRLNPNRAERTLAPARPTDSTMVPQGYRVAWEDGRLNPSRGVTTAPGNAQTQQVWTNTVPRTLQKVPTDRQVIQNPNPQNPGLPRARKSTRSEPNPAAQQQTARAQPKSQPTKRRYIRVATYNSDADARASAKALVRRTGLEVRLGTLHRKGKTYRVVMAGPFTTDASANSAMSKVRGAGFSKARLSK